MMRLLVTTSAALVAVAGLAGPAAAQRTTLHDPAGDATGPLDVTSVQVANKPGGVLARVRFDEVAAGDLVVSVDRRRGQGVRVVSRYRPGRAPTARVLPGAFTDPEVAGSVRCGGVRARWDAAADTAVLWLPARCLNGGRYGDIRFAVLTEEDGGDSDYAPQTADGELGSSRWLPRG